MIELFQKFTFSEVATFIILFALAIKGVVSFFEWGQQKISKVLHIKNGKVAEKEQMKQQLQKNTELIEKLTNKQNETDKYLQKMSEKIDLLIKSDRDDIKSYITREHHRFCYELKEIDDFSLDCLEKRYKHYADEGGNSFINGFMEDLRKLPKYYYHRD